MHMLMLFDPRRSLLVERARTNHSDRKGEKMKACLRLLTICLFVIGFSAIHARADVVYTFSGTNDTPGADGLPVAFTYTAPDFLTGTPPPYDGTALNAAQLQSCLNCSSIDPVVVFEPNNSGIGDAIIFADVNDQVSAYMFPLDSFGTPGSYSSVLPFSSGTLNVAVTVPEPGSLALTLTGGVMLALVCFSKRKAASGAQLA
jgi:hypothetical protein